VVLQSYSTPVERRSVRLDDAPFEQPTVWGLKPSQIHDCFWAAHGVQPIRCGEETKIAQRAKLFLLTPSDSLVKFKLHQLMETMHRLKNCVKPQVVFVKLKERRGNSYRERIVTDDQNRFLRFQRMYGGVDRRSTTIALTPEPHIARAWQSSPNPEVGFALLHEHISEGRLAETSLPGCAYNMAVASDVMQCVRDLIDAWEQPNTVLTRIHEVSSGVWADKDTWVHPDAKLVGPIWIGTGRAVDAKTSIVGPAVLWDDPAARPKTSRVAWERVKTRPTRRRRSRRERKEGFARSARKRAFDILFALVAIASTAPLYPFIMLAIWLADGRPFFFAHRRETLGGYEFPCLKFRSMFRNAEQVKGEYQKKNQVDGPQFFIENDPRVTRVGRFLRRSKLDELPQFLNVLVGHMSVVGPRPSPFVENQCCPAWREARLSVRPGITGLWQLKRTRQKGLDFQEWIKYDIEYVENSSWRLDLWILWHTVRNVLRELL
jgi:lipopolysaccharide/colanic/teichoic acid biosynthesis glycosyltransferase